jgi:outer membrane protein assembly factor BamD (BamD/ComL family)
VDSVEVYLAEIDSLTKSNLTEDSLYYFKSLALETICKTLWYCHEGCGGCDFSLVTNKIKSFQSKYPTSNLSDNSMLYLIEMDYLYNDREDKSLIAKIMDYENFLKKYPDSDLKPDVQFSIFMTWASMQNRKKEKIKATAKRFISESGTDKRIKDVKQRLKELEIR